LAIESEPVDARRQQVESPVLEPAYQGQASGESKKLIKALNIHHQAKRIQKWEVNDPERTRGRKYDQPLASTFAARAQRPLHHPFLTPARSWTVVVVNQLLPWGSNDERVHVRPLAEAR
jgi:hypothetical protein